MADEESETQQKSLEQLEYDLRREALLTLQKALGDGNVTPQQLDTAQIILDATKE